MLHSKSYHVIVQTDETTGDLLIPLPEGLLSEVGWKYEDQISFGIDASGRLVLTKIDSTN